VVVVVVVVVASIVVVLLTPLFPLFPLLPPPQVYYTEIPRGPDSTDPNPHSDETPGDVLLSPITRMEAVPVVLPPPSFSEFKLPTTPQGWVQHPDSRYAMPKEEGGGKRRRRLRAPGGRE